LAVWNFPNHIEAYKLLSVTLSKTFKTSEQLSISKIFNAFNYAKNAARQSVFLSKGTVGEENGWVRRKEKVWQLFQSCKIELQINLPTAVLIHHNGRFSLGRNCWGKYRGEIDLKWKSMLRWLCANSSSNNLVKSLEIPFPFCLSSGVSVRG